jgi:protocatechuate 3,4-dioxygenase beta subunit
VTGPIGVDASYPNSARDRRRADRLERRKELVVGARLAARRAILAVLFVLVLAILVLACGEESGTTPTSTTTTLSGPATTEGAPTTGGPPTTTTTSASSTTEGATTTVAAGGTSTTQTAEGSGALTVGVTEGPYYITNTKELTDGNLNYTSLPGDPISVTGYVYGGAGNTTPLAGARIEIWQTDSEGNYHPATNGDAADFAADELALRGAVLTDAEGRYEFTSIYPGIYPGRCRHIHVRASAETYGSVVTQMIVPALPGDSQTPETDQIAQTLPAANDLQFTASDGVQQAAFDFHLAGD